MSRLMVKVASLSKQDQSAFKKTSEGRYVLARVLQKYDWDDGSVWDLVKDPNSGDLLLARVEEKFNKTANMNILSTKLVCDTCRRDLDEVIVGNNIFKMCSRCDGKTIASMKEAAQSDTQGQIGDPSSSTGINIHAIAEPLPTRLVEHIQAWVEAGMTNFEDGALKVAIETAHRLGALNNSDAHILGAALPLVRETALATAEAASFETSLGNPFAEGDMAQDMNGHVDLADQAMAALTAIAPRGMKISTAMKLIASLREESALSVSALGGIKYGDGLEAVKDVTKQGVKGIIFPKGTQVRARSTQDYNGETLVSLEAPNGEMYWFKLADFKKVADRSPEDEEFFGSRGASLRHSASAKNDWVSAKIKKLVGEGKEQKQAVAIAEEMYRKQHHEAAMDLNTLPKDEKHEEEVEMALFNDLDRDVTEEREIVDWLEDMHEGVKPAPEEDLHLEEED